MNKIKYLTVIVSLIFVISGCASDNQTKNIDFEDKPLVRTKEDLNYYPESFSAEEIKSNLLSIFEDNNNYAKTTMLNVENNPEMYRGSMFCYEAIVKEIKMSEDKKEIQQLTVTSPEDNEKIRFISTIEPYSNYKDILFANNIKKENIPNNAVTQNLYNGDRVVIYCNFQGSLISTIRVELLKES